MTLRQRLRVYIQDVWNKCDLTAIILFIIGLICRYGCTKIILIIIVVVVVVVCMYVVAIVLIWFGLWHLFQVYSTHTCTYTFCRNLNPFTLCTALFALIQLQHLSLLIFLVYFLFI